MNQQRLLDRFLQYVRIDTTAVDGAATYPSSPGQWELGKLIERQLRDMGLADARQDEHGIVLATIPANNGGAGPVLAFNAHLDTSPETTGKNVQPQVIGKYGGGDLRLPGDPSQVTTVEKCPALAGLIGKTLVTSDGTTLLGADDKAGVAIMMELAQHLLENPTILRGPVRLLFTCDEEIGRGVQHVDIQRLAADVCYTFDGGGQNEIDQETFSADLAVIGLHGVNTHPGVAKDKLVNAVRMAGAFLEMLPRELAPERTGDRDGFLHPYILEGGVAKTEIKILLRSFETAQLEPFAQLLRGVAQAVEREFPGSRAEVQIKRQYRNMRDGLAKEPRAVQFAVEAHRRLGREPKLTIIRGGTDGSQLTERGLPTPNLSSGQHNIHSPLEFACLDEMLAACEIGVELVKLWSNASQAS
jgi:tripeptide aminopeptidase